MDQTILITIILLIIINSYGFIYSYLITNKSILLNKRIQTKRMGLDILKKRTPLVLFNMSILIILNCLGLYYFKEYYIKEYVGMIVVFFEVVFILVIDDMFFYILHRLMHENKFIYRKIHKIHHRANTPIPIDYIYVHPLEWSSGMIGPFIGMFMLGGISIYSFWIYLILRNLHELHIHSGIATSFFTRIIPFYGDNEHHDVHHSIRDGNYSSTFVFWDKLLKTKL